MEDYTIKDIVLLMNILLIRHRLSCSLISVKNKQCISIDKKSMPLLLRNIRPFITSMPLLRGNRPFITSRPISTFSFYLTSHRLYSKSSKDSSANLCNPVLSYENADVEKKLS